MNANRLYHIEKLLRKGDIVCTLLPLVKSPCLSEKTEIPTAITTIDDLDEEEDVMKSIEELKLNRVDDLFHSNPPTMHTSLDSILDALLREIEKYPTLLLEKLKVRTILFFRCNRNGAGWHLFNSPSTFTVKTMDSGESKFDFLSKIECATGTFAPFASSHRRFFNFYESNEVSNSLERFYLWTLEQQLATFTYTFNGDPVACSIGLLSLICKTNRNCYYISNQNELKMTPVKTEPPPPLSYCLYKIQNHVMILFGLSGTESFVRDCLLNIHRHILSHGVFHIVYPKRSDSSLLSKDILSWEKVTEDGVSNLKEEMIFLEKNGWEQRSYILKQRKPIIELRDGNTRVVATVEPVKPKVLPNYPPGAK
jgi:hypothetical protein